MPLTASEVKDKIRKYIEGCTYSGEPPLIGTMARMCGVAGRRGLERLKKELPEASVYIDIGFAAVEEFYEGTLARICQQGSVENAKSAYSAMFMLKTFGWRDSVSEESVELVSAIQNALNRVVEEKQKLAIGVQKDDVKLSLEVLDATASE